MVTGINCLIMDELSFTGLPHVELWSLAGSAAAVLLTDLSRLTQASLCHVPAVDSM